MMDEAERNDADGLAPPYIPFRTFTNLLVRMQTEGAIPRRIDRGYLNNLAGGTIPQVIAALRSLGMIDADERPQRALTTLVEAGEQRPERVAELFRARYPWAIELGETNATHQELEEAFRQHGVSGSTLRKAIAFYLQGARYAGLPLSPFFREPRASSEGAAARQRRPRQPRRVRQDESGQGQQQGHQPSPAPFTDDQMKHAYFELLRKKADEAEQPSADLFDRIERLLGIEPKQNG